MLYPKRWLGDQSVSLVECVVPAEKAEQIRRGISPPDGVDEKRVIAPKVKGMILRQAPKCAARGEITQEAADYLAGWCQGNLPPVPRPASYQVLSYRWDRSPLPAPGSWMPPLRMKHVNVSLPESPQDSDSEGSADEGPDDLPALQM